MTTWPVIDRSEVSLPPGHESGLRIADFARVEDTAHGTQRVAENDPRTFQIDLSDWIGEGTGRSAEGGVDPIVVDLDALGGLERLDSLFLKGDRILFGLELDSEGEVERWTMELRIDEALSKSTGGGSRTTTRVVSSSEQSVEFRAHLYDGHVSLWNELGELIGESAVAVPHLVGNGFARTCLVLEELLLEPWTDELAGEVDPELSRRFFSALAPALVSLVSVMTIINENALLAPILMKVARTPSLFSLIGNLGVELDVVLDLEHQVRLLRPGAETPWDELPEGPFFTFPATITANGEQALWLDFFITAPTPPLAACGGVLAFVARNPSRDVAFRMNVIGANRPGDEGGEPASKGP